jgi:polyhydroxybutyrate depolymerase
LSRNVTGVSRRCAVVILVMALVAGCSSSAHQPAANAARASTAGKGVTINLGSRPLTLYVPSTYHEGSAVPLVVLLHGYTSNGAEQESYLKFRPEAEKRGFLYATPDGTQDARGNRFWAGTDACCNLFGAVVDDSAYLSELIASVSAKYTVDTRKVYLVGHSNGAFMSYRMACEHADLVTAIAALNGAMWNDLSRCAPSKPVSVLHITGTNDTTIVPTGGQIAGNTYPSTATTVSDWVGLDGCSPTPHTTMAPMDLESNVDGAETTVSRYTGCRGDATVELWTMRAGSHIPAFTPAFAPAVVDFLLARSR